MATADNRISGGKLAHWGIISITATKSSKVKV